MIDLDHVALATDRHRRDARHARRRARRHRLLRRRRLRLPLGAGPSATGGDGMTVELLDRVASRAQRLPRPLRRAARRRPHHLTFKVPDLAATLERVRAAGFKPVERRPRRPALEGGVPPAARGARHRRAARADQRRRIRARAELLAHAPSRRRVLEPRVVADRRRRAAERCPLRRVVLAHAVAAGRGRLLRRPARGRGRSPRTTTARRARVAGRRPRPPRARPDATPGRRPARGRARRGRPRRSTSAAPACPLVVALIPTLVPARRVLAPTICEHGRRAPPGRRARAATPSARSSASRRGGRSAIAKIAHRRRARAGPRSRAGPTPGARGDEVGDEPDALDLDRHRRACTPRARGHLLDLVAQRVARRRQDQRMLATSAANGTGSAGSSVPGGASPTSSSSSRCSTDEPRVARPAR